MAKGKDTWHFVAVVAECWVTLGPVDSCIEYVVDISGIKVQYTRYGVQND